MFPCLLTCDFKRVARAINAAEDEFNRSFVKVSPADLNTTCREVSCGAAVATGPAEAVTAAVGAAVVGDPVVVGAFGSPATAKHEGWNVLEPDLLLRFPRLVRNVFSESTSPAKKQLR